MRSAPVPTPVTDLTHAGADRSSRCHPVAVRRDRARKAAIFKVPRHLGTRASPCNPGDRQRETSSGVPDRRDDRAVTGGRDLALASTRGSMGRRIPHQHIPAPR